MKWGRLAGLCFAILGLVVYAALKMIQDNQGVVFRIALLGPILVGFGIGMVIAPGSKLTVADVRQDPSRRDELISDARWFHLVLWVGLAVVAAIMATERFGLLT